MTSKLTIRSKLAAALAVPLIALAALVAVQVRDSVGDTNNAHTQADLATSATGPGGHRVRPPERAQPPGRACDRRRQAGRPAGQDRAGSHRGDRQGHHRLPQQSRQPGPAGGRRIPAGARGHRARHRRHPQDRGHARRRRRRSTPRTSRLRTKCSASTRRCSASCSTRTRVCRSRSTTPRCAPVSSCWTR